MSRTRDCSPDQRSAGATAMILLATQPRKRMADRWTCRGRASVAGIIPAASGICRDPCAVAADPAVAPTPGFAPGEKDPSALGAVTSAQVARVWIEHEIDDGSTEQMRNAAKGVAAAWCRATCCR